MQVLGLLLVFFKTDYFAHYIFVTFSAGALSPGALNLESRCHIIIYRERFSDSHGCENLVALPQVWLSAEILAPHLEVNL